MKIQYRFNDWKSGEEIEEVLDIDVESIRTIHSSYDGGRFYLYINSVLVFEKLDVGYDVSIDVTILEI